MEAEVKSRAQPQAEAEAEAEAEEGEAAAEALAMEVRRQAGENSRRRDSHMLTLLRLGQGFPDREPNQQGVNASRNREEGRAKAPPTIRKPLLKLLAVSVLENRTIIIFWISILVGIIGVLNYEFLRGNGWASMDTFAGQWVDYYNRKTGGKFDASVVKEFICKQGETILYYDDSTKNLVENGKTRFVMSFVLGVAVVSVVLALSLHFGYSYRINHSFGSVKFVLEQAMWSKSIFRSIQDLATLAVLIALTIGAITVGIEEVNKNTTPDWGVVHPQVLTSNGTVAYYTVTDDDFVPIAVSLNGFELAIRYWFECVLAWIAIIDIFTVSTVVTRQLIDHAPEEEIYLPSILYCPSENIVESILSIAMVPTQIIGNLKSLAESDHPDFVHLDKVLISSLTVTQLYALKSMWSNTSQLSILQPQDVGEDDLLRNEGIQPTAVAGSKILRVPFSPRDSVYTSVNNDQTQTSPAAPPPPRSASAGQLEPGRWFHILFSTRDNVLFWFAFFTLTTEASQLWALPIAQKVDCFEIADLRRTVTRGVFYAFGAVCLVAMVITKTYIVYSQTKAYEFKSLSYILHLEYSKKSPAQRAISLLSLWFTGVCCIILIGLVSSNVHVYPSSLARLILTIVTMVYAGLRGYFQTSIVGLQHLDNIPDITIPMKCWTPSEKVMDQLMRYAVLEDAELLRVRARAEAAKQSRHSWIPALYSDPRNHVDTAVDIENEGAAGVGANSREEWHALSWMRMDELSAEYALHISAADLIRMKRHLWGEYCTHADIQVYAHYSRSFTVGLRSLKFW